ncbi:type II toxin-antitoxin system HicA family toxin [uncultured Porphyromonas sp.]|uniref:type II toxin-antitoxin system HicA family toxin n=1 Tax=uncultured Porphyromonas sp. TaxID=159274 RepID=UPI0028052271|nr:type II toxin-antitoxin system HicA family toxin [uncultured Porphyromonas sp.]
MNDNNAPHYTELPIVQLEANKEQIDGLPATPRNIQPDKLAKLKRSILDNPEMLQLRGILVYPHGDKYIVIGGNMRLRAMVELGMTSAPCVVIPSHVTADIKVTKITPRQTCVYHKFVIPLYCQSKARMKYSELVRQIKALGWYKLKRGGSHDAYAHPTIRGRITMPRHGSKEVPAGTEKAILKQAKGGK